MIEKVLVELSGKFIYKSEASHHGLPYSKMWGGAFNPTVETWRTWRSMAWLVGARPGLARTESSFCCDVRTKLIIRTGWLWLWLQGKKSNSDEWVSADIYYFVCLDWGSRTLWLQRPEFYWIGPCWSIRVWQEPPHLPLHLLSYWTPPVPSLSPGRQLTFYSFSLSFYLYTSGFLASEGSV